jgi:hypothetical protein
MATMRIDGKNTGTFFCGYCGGNAGQLNERGIHNLCEARRENGNPTPSLGLQCLDCNGSGFDPKRGLKAGQSIYNPNGHHLARAFPKCESCDGKGSVDEDTYYGRLAELQEISEQR